MEAVSLDRMRISGSVQLKAILDVQVDASVNEHAYMKVYAILDDTDGKEFYMRSVPSGELCFSCDFGSGMVPCFSGKIVTAEVTEKNKTYFFHAVCVSGSREFDKKKKSCSFQDVSMPYKRVLQETATTGNIVAIKAKNKAIGYPIIRYQETDWEFVRRLASRFNTVVIPEITNSYPQISFGVVNGRTYALHNPIEYEVHKDIESYWAKKAAGSPCSPSDFVYYKVKDYQNFNLGDKVLFQKQPFVVMEKRMRFSESLLVNTYTLGTENGFGIKRFYNEKTSGLTLEGRVLWTGDEKVKVKLDIDAEQDVGTAYPFPYVPISGNIMYSMPEKGARISIYIPNREEDNLMAAGCQRERIGHPHHMLKFMATPHNKHLMMSPHVMKINSAKGVKNSIKLSDKLGICFETNKKIRIKATKDIAIQSRGYFKANALALVGLYQLETNSVELIDNNAVITSPNLYNSAVIRKEEKFCGGLYEEPLPNISDIVPAILGGMTAGDVDGAAAAVMGGIPSSCNPNSTQSSGSGKVSSKH